MSALQDPMKVYSVEFSNRVVMAPMVPFGYQGEADGSLGQEHILHYLRRANGVGLMISQALSPCEEELNHGLGVYSREQTGPLRTIADACHENDTRFFVQLAYPSDGFYGGDSVNHLEARELERIAGQFIHAAALCRDAGCDGVELHGAHTYFLNMLASQTANKRTDAYGGGLSGRLHMAERIIRGIRRFAGADFIVCYRMGWTEDMDTDIRTARALEDMGVQMLHVSGGIPRDRELEIPGDFDYNEYVCTASVIHEHVGVPVIAVNDIRNFARGEALIENDLCDFAAYGKPFLADADFYLKSLRDSFYEPCLQCDECAWFEHGPDCPVHRSLERLR
ncbi:MAG: NADH:flavin oxidoreductase [Christensenellales bacterium]